MELSEAPKASTSMRWTRRRTGLLPVPWTRLEPIRPSARTPPGRGSRPSSADVSGRRRAMESNTSAAPRRGSGRPSAGSARSSARRSSPPTRSCPRRPPAHRAGDAGIREQAPERLAGISAAAIGMVRQCVRLSSPPDRQDEGIGHEPAIIAAFIDPPATRRENSRSPPRRRAGLPPSRCG